MHDLDRKTCRYIAYALLLLALVDKLCLYFVPIPLQNIEIIAHSSDTLGNILLVMAGFFYGASAKFKDSDREPPEGSIVTTVEKTNTETQTQVEQPKAS